MYLLFTHALLFSRGDEDDIDGDARGAVVGPALPGGAIAGVRRGREGEEEGELNPEVVELRKNGTKLRFL